MSEDLEEKAIVEFLKYNPVPAVDYHLVYNEDGSINEEIKDTPHYKGLVDGLLERPYIFMHSTIQTAFAYSKAYDCGSKFRKAKN